MELHHDSTCNVGPRHEECDWWDLSLLVLLALLRTLL